MTKDEILKLSRMARISISNSEAEILGKDIKSVLGYVSVVKEITEDKVTPKKVGVIYNVFREDEVTVEPESYTNVIMNEAPHVRNGRFEVKKILNTD